MLYELLHVNHRRQMAVISTLLSVGTVIATFTPPQLNCSQLHVPVFFPELDDTLSQGDVLFTTNDGIVNITDCEGKELLAYNRSVVTLNAPMQSLCTDNFVCTFKCALPNNTVIILNVGIKRTLPYHVSFAKTVYTGSVQELAPKDTAVRLDADLSIKIHNCIVSDFIISTRQFSIAQSGPPVPFSWRTETNPNSLVVSGVIDHEANSSFTFYVKLSMLNLNVTGSNTAKIVINVIDIDDNYPEFNITASENYLLNITENDCSLVNKPLETSPPVYAFDPDLGINQTILYSIREQPVAGLFGITSDGKIIVTRTLDYQEQNNYMIVIQAAQKDNPTVSIALAILIVKVIYRDEQPPKDNQERTIIIGMVISSLVTITVVIATSVIIGCLLVRRFPLNNRQETGTRVRKDGGNTLRGDGTVNNYYEELDQPNMAKRVKRLPKRGAKIASSF